MNSLYKYNIYLNLKDKKENEIFRIINIIKLIIKEIKEPGEQWEIIKSDKNDVIYSAIPGESLNYPFSLSPEQKKDKILRSLV